MTAFGLFVIVASLGAFSPALRWDRRRQDEPSGRAVLATLSATTLAVLLVVGGASIVLRQPDPWPTGGSGPSGSVPLLTSVATLTGSATVPTGTAAPSGTTVSPSPGAVTRGGPCGRPGEITQDSAGHLLRCTPDSVDGHRTGARWR